MFGNPAFNEGRPSREATATVGYRDVCGKCGARRIDLQIGLEVTPAAYVAGMVKVFREIRRVLREDGCAWLNVGDSYAGGKMGRDDGGCNSTSFNGQPRHNGTKPISRPVPPGYKQKDLLGIPWMLAFALRDDGWWLRSEIIWCLSGGTWLYAKTRKGEMPVMIKDLVRLDPATIKLWNGEKWTRVLGWNRSADDGEKLELVLRSGERIGCTGNHQWPTQRGNVRANELVSGDVIRACDLPEPQGAIRPAYLTELACWFIGLYLAEGSMADDTIQISAHADELHWVDDLSLLAKHYGGTVTHTLDGNNLSIRVYSRVLRAILETYVGGSKAIDKHLKVAAWGLDNHSLSQIAVGYLAGDGHNDWKNRRVRLGFCRNYALERDLRTLAARLGATLTLKPVTAQYQDGPRPAFRGEWRWNRSGHWSEKDRGEVVEIRKSRARQCWDIGVEDEPHLFALASGVLTHNSKPNPMPESVTDRPTKAHEQVFLLTKNERYFYDMEGVKEKASDVSRPAQPGYSRSIDSNPYAGQNAKPWGEQENRNLRSVWTITPRPFAGAHFATMPVELADRCIRAGTSERGCCPTCGKAWERVVEIDRPEIRYRERKDSAEDKPGNPMSRNGTHNSGLAENAFYRRSTTGFRQSCPCPARKPVPCLVLDPFSGASTTGVAALALGRRYVGFDLSAEYLEMSRRRIERPHMSIRKVDRPMPLFAGMEDAP